LFDQVIRSESIDDVFSSDLAVFVCLDCKVVQTLQDVDFSSYYSSYEYAASQSAFVRNYLRSLVQECSSRGWFKSGDLVVEVGAADGYLLSLFQELGARVLGFEPAVNLTRVAREVHRVEVVPELFDSSSLLRFAPDVAGAQLVVLLHTFDHLPEPGSFLDQVAVTLDPGRGILLVEVHDLEQIIEKNEVSLFGHEHTVCLHYQPIRSLLENHGFKLVGWRVIPTEKMRGSSVLFAASLQGSSIPEFEESNNTPDVGILDDRVLRERFGEISRAYRRLHEYVVDRKRVGLRIAGYGGWGRGVTTIAMARLDKSHLEFVVDSNPSLSGCVTPSGLIPIVQPDVVSRSVVDEVIVFNYAYIQEIQEVHRDFTSHGGRIVSVMEILAPK
jgi:hypothetical protein